VSNTKPLKRVRDGIEAPFQNTAIMLLSFPLANPTMPDSESLTDKSAATWRFAAALHAEDVANAHKNRPILHEDCKTVHVETPDVTFVLD